MAWYWSENPGAEEDIGMDRHDHEVRSHNLTLLHRNTCTLLSQLNLPELRCNRRKQDNIAHNSSMAWREPPPLPHSEENKQNQEPLVGHTTTSW